jgi:ribonuclease HI
MSNFEDIIYCDGCCNKITNGNSWASIVDKNNNCLIKKYKNLLNLENEFNLIEHTVGSVIRDVIIVKFDDVKSQQNNGAELIALLISLKIANLLKNKITILCDSNLLIQYWSKGRINPKTKEKMDKNKLKYIEEVTLLRKKFEENGNILEKISGNDNKADLGFHVSKKR